MTLSAKLHTCRETLPEHKDSMIPGIAGLEENGWISVGLNFTFERVPVCCSRFSVPGTPRILFMLERAGAPA